MSKRVTHGPRHQNPSRSRNRDRPVIARPLPGTPDRARRRPPSCSDAGRCLAPPPAAVNRDVLAEEVRIGPPRRQGRGIHHRGTEGTEKTGREEERKKTKHSFILIAILLS